jgi:hypothetical protein
LAYYTNTTTTITAAFSLCYCCRRRRCCRLGIRKRRRKRRNSSVVDAPSTTTVMTIREASVTKAPKNTTNATSTHRGNRSFVGSAMPLQRKRIMHPFVLLLLLQCLALLSSVFAVGQTTTVKEITDSVWYGKNLKVTFAVSHFGVWREYHDKLLSCVS